MIDATPSSTFARSALDLAAQVEAAEHAIKRALLRAAEAGDLERVQYIVTLWLERPPTEVARALALAPHGSPECRGTGGLE